MKVKLLSDLVDGFLCGASEGRVPDEFFSVGCYLVGTPPPMKDAAALADLHRQAYGLTMIKDFYRPHLPGAMGKDEYKVAGTEIMLVNDLFVPGNRLDEDGFMHIHFAVPVSMPLSSTLMAKDWRFLALAWIAVIDSKTAPTKMIFTAIDATGRRVMTLVEPELLDAFKSMIQSRQRNKEVPGPVCVRCKKADKCETLQELLDPVLEGAATSLPKDRNAVSSTLFYSRMELETRMEVLEEKKRKTDQALTKLCVDGMLNIGGESVQLPRRKGHQWDYSRAYHILMGAGLWRDAFGSIKVAAIQAALNEFPAEIRKKLEAAMVETISEPSISEAAKHGRSIPTQILRGITFRR